MNLQCDAAPKTQFQIISAKQWVLSVIFSFSFILYAFTEIHRIIIYFGRFPSDGPRRGSR
ncbi:hypothetical protein SAMN06272755_2692 [Picosynechococcus sp. OG1]|nr:hypothetical protein SAMN06272755_2692 [Picosynechococcus sp. OG1]SMQ82732.1 hypothetical protein SAMN06272774_1968 [Synechococcus sp. 7002]